MLLALILLLIGAVVSFIFAACLAGKNSLLEAALKEERETHEASRAVLDARDTLIERLRVALVTRNQTIENYRRVVDQQALEHSELLNERDRLNEFANTVIQAAAGLVSKNTDEGTATASEEVVARTAEEEVAAISKA